MKHIAELLGFVFAVLICVWVIGIVTAPPVEKPIAVCKPLILVTGLVGDAGAAANPAAGNILYRLGYVTSKGCLGYTAKLMNVVHSQNEPAAGEQ